VQFVRTREDGDIAYDYVEEFDSLQTLRRAGLVEVELHGYTHIFPDREAWLSAHDRHSSNSWYREFGAEAVRFFVDNPGLTHPIDDALEIFGSHFNATPVALICPGEEFTNHVLIKALEAGMMLVSSYYLALRERDRFCWTQHVYAPYLDTADSKWFDSGLPVVGYFHDFDIARRGVDWFGRCLDHWQLVGAGRIIDLNELSAALNMKSAINQAEHGWELSVFTEARHPLPRSFKLNVFFPDGDVPSEISAVVNSERVSLKVLTTGRHTGIVTVPS
jgi:hypothetical protein